MNLPLNLRTKHRCWEGTVAYYSHYSPCCDSEMRFSIFLPPQAQSRSCPVLYYLSGLTCTEENFTVKAGAQRYAAETGLIIVAPDTSPRNTGIPAEDETWDLGSSASFYLDATQPPWSSHYQMFNYITRELPELIAQSFPVLPERQGICGHSMGGHGALICALKKPQQYLSVSAFAPIAALSHTDWGKKALSAYLGENAQDWLAYDASHLVKSSQISSSILIDQGLEDQFYLDGQLLPEHFEHSCLEAGQEVKLRFHPGYDHSYFMIATLIEDHILHHSRILNS